MLCSFSALALLHGVERQVYGDSGYLGAEKREENKDKDVEWVIAVRHGQRRKLRDSETEKGRLTDKIEQLKKARFVPKSSIRFTG